MGEEHRVPWKFIWESGSGAVGGSLTLGSRRGHGGRRGRMRRGRDLAGRVTDASRGGRDSRVSPLRPAAWRLDVVLSDASV